MSEELDIENTDSLNGAEDSNDNADEVDTDPTENPEYKEYWVKKVETLEETNRKLYARLKNKPVGTNLKGVENSLPEISERLEKLELKTEGFSDQEIEFLKPYGGKKALENQYVKAALDAMREKDRAESAVVDVNSNKSDIEKKFTEDQLRNMPLEELEKLLPKS